MGIPYESYGSYNHDINANVSFETQKIEVLSALFDLCDISTDNLGFVVDNQHLTESGTFTLSGVNSC